MKKLFLSLAAVTALAGSVQAAPMLRFDNDVVDGGTISYDGVGGALIGSDIEFDRIKGTDTPLQDGGILLIADGFLDFATGLNISEGIDAYSWEGGGSFKLTGLAFFDKNMDGVFSGALIDLVVAVGTDADPLLSGHFDRPLGSPVKAENGGTAGWTISGWGVDTKHAGLLAFFGLKGEDFVFASTEITAAFEPDTTTFAFYADVDEADLRNVQVIPEPATASVALLGLGAVGMGVKRRRA